MLDYVLASTITKCIHEKYNITRNVDSGNEQGIELVIQFVVNSFKLKHTEVPNDMHQPNYDASWTSGMNFLQIKGL